MHELTTKPQAIILIGDEIIKNLSAKTIDDVAEQYSIALAKHKKTMLQLTPEGIKKHIIDNQMILAFDPQNPTHLVAGARLLYHKNHTYEFCSWLAFESGFGKQVIVPAKQLALILDPKAKIYALLEKSNHKAHTALGKAGGKILEARPRDLYLYLTKEDGTKADITYYTLFEEKSMKNINKIYGGIYTKEPTKQTDMFLIDAQQQQAESDIAPFYLWETLAHNYMLAKQQIVPEKEAKEILKKLLFYLQETEKTPFILNPTIGDIHEHIEQRLTQDIGEVAGWMHIARSRNDQVTTDQKLITKHLLFTIFHKLHLFSDILGQKTSQYKDVIMPGFTHLRVAMPSSFGFWWQAYLEQIIECETILQSVFIAIDKSPLGAGASYGVNWSINPTTTSQDLGFSQPFTNALAAINARGIHEMYLLGPLCNLMTIISKMMEDIIIFSMPEINYLAIDEGFTEGSSIMPQKMNPDVAEKARSKAANLLGFFVTTCMTLKATPSGFNRDSAETKISIINALKTTIETLTILSDMLPSITPNKQAMEKAVLPSLATKLADALTQKYHIPFRQSHHIVGKALLLADKDITKITNKILEKALVSVTGGNITIAKDLIEKILDPHHALNDLSYLGSPNPKFVERVNETLLEKNKHFAEWVTTEEKKFYHARENLIKKVATFLEE